MRAEPAVAPVLPRYGESSLPDLASSLLASLGIAGEPNPLGLPPTARVCLLVVDGLGWELLRDQPAAAPFLSELAVNGAPLTAGFPATTVTSLSSLGTGRPPGQHGMLGYQVAMPGKGKLLNGLRWDNSVDPLAWQPGSTIYERAAEAGVSTLPRRGSALEKTGLSTAVMRGNCYRPADSLGALAAEAADALRGRTARWSPCTTPSWTAPGTCSAAGPTHGASSSVTWTSWPSSWRRRSPRGPRCM